MRVAYKQVLEHTAAPQRFVLPGFEKVLHVGLQHEKITVWYLAEPGSNVHDSRTFQIFGTGDPTIWNDAEFLGTVQQPPYVWHVFEVENS